MLRHIDSMDNTHQALSAAAAAGGQEGTNREAKTTKKSTSSNKNTHGGTGMTVMMLTPAKSGSDLAAAFAPTVADQAALSAEKEVRKNVH